MVIADAGDRIVLLNVQAERLFGYQRDELLGEPITRLVPVRAMGLDVVGVRKDGTEFSVEITRSPIETKDGPLVSSAIRDITERKRAEAELRRAKDTAETAGRELEAFSYLVAHDLRSPLRSINGFSAALLDDLGDKLDAQAKHHLERIGLAATRMAEIIDALLQLSKVSRSGTTRGVVDVTRIANDVVAQLRAAPASLPTECVIAEGLVAERRSTARPSAAREPARERVEVRVQAAATARRGRP